ncbi:hypothetical protein B1R94_24925 [Mycolicibacterium litorale]|nr:hypothetical protein B1R94_24925 [Mycolicibacterium litorale]
MDRFERDLLTFLLSWAPYGDPPGTDCFLQFGMSTERLRERCLQVVCTTRPTDLRDPERSLLVRAGRLLLGNSRQRVTKRDQDRSGSAGRGPGTPSD